MSKHTPGPWMADIESDACFVKRPEGGPLAHFPIYVPGTHAESAADARLIAAAPELLAACKRLMVAHDRISCLRAEQAIAKAEGRE